MRLPLILERIKAILTNRKAHIEAPTELVNVDIDSLFEGPEDPWYTNTYYSIYRFFRWNCIFHPSKWYYNTKYFIQRGYRGWSIRDTWSIDYYLNSWMPEALEYLKKHKHGFPCSMFKDDEADLYNNWHENEEAAKSASDRASAKWDVIIDKMIEGFKASKRINDGLYEEELGQYPTRCPKNVSKDTWKHWRDYRFELCRILEERDEKLRVEGMNLFVVYYNSLWD